MTTIEPGVPEMPHQKGGGKGKQDQLKTLRIQLSIHSITYFSN
jgi:hypothetical protein